MIVLSLKVLSGVKKDKPQKEKETKESPLQGIVRSFVRDYNVMRMTLP
ncbi:MAG: hypothetical protein PWP39_1374 [Pyrococcus sp.]|nr:hypothetical protein [Pyrococcus sp.]